MKRKITRKIKRPCNHPGCMAIGVIRVEDGKWLCLPDTQARINLSHNQALTQADEDLESFGEQGGEPS